MRRAIRPLICLSLASFLLAAWVWAHGPGAVAEYRLDDGVGLLALDNSVNGLHGVLQGGPVWTAGRANGALSFDGVNDYVELGNSPHFNHPDAITIIAWIKTTTIGVSQFIVAKDNLPTGTLQYFLRVQGGGSVRMGVRTTADFYATSPPLLLPNNWHHVAGVYDGFTMQVYVDGQRAGSPVSVTGLMTDNGVGVRIGGRQNGNLPFRGVIDEVSIYNRPLSAAEVQALYSGVALDVTPPTGAITSPAQDATVSGVIAVDANATDNVGMTGVQFLVDGNNIGSQDTSAPYSVFLNTSTLVDGPHILTAVLRDVSGNTATTAPISIIVNNFIPDTIPPILTNGQPSGSLPPGTSQAVISVTSNENATCRYSATAGVPYGSMTNTFSTTGATAHSTTVTGLFNGQTFTFFVRCRDAAGNENTADFAISFFVESLVTGLRGFYHLDEGFGLTANDASGNANDGTLVNGPTWVTSGKAGGALRFDGINDYVNLGNAPSLNPSGAITLAAWINTTTTARAQFIVAKDNLPTGALQYFLRLQGTSVRLGIRTAADRYVTSPAVITTNTWYHVAGVYDGSTMRLYVNGQLSGSPLSVTGSMTNNGVAARIGGRQDGALSFQGVIDEVSIYDRALSVSEIQSLFSFGSGSGPDTTSPTVAMTAPALGAQLSGTATVSADATDNVGVISVQFLVDGNNIGQADSTAPYSAALDTTTLTDGNHILTAMAKDAAGNASTTVPWNIRIMNDPTIIGRVAPPFIMPDVAIHAILMHTGDVLFWADASTVPGTAAYVWTPSTGAFQPVPLSRTDLFCSGHVALADGRIFVLGGDGRSAAIGTAAVNLFDPVTRQWTAATSMAYPRWYPTGTVLPDGRVLAMSGATTCFTCLADIPEIFDPATNTWTQLTSARMQVPYYPYMFLLPDGRVVDAGADEHPVVTQVLDLTTQAWSVVDPVVVDGGSAVMYAPGKIIKSGSSKVETPVNSIASASTYALDMNQTTPQWRMTASMNFPRIFHTLTLLPDGNVVVTGGTRFAGSFNPNDAVHEVELWSPQSETWSVMAKNQVDRLYHATALLMPDATVLISGSGANSGPDQKNGEIFSPPYLFRGPRPTISSAPSFAQYGSTFSVDSPEAFSIARVTLVRPGAMTHTFDQDQRLVELTFQTNGNTLVINAPTDARLAPPGYYMLFLLDTNGVPSVARFIRIGP